MDRERVIKGLEIILNGCDEIQCEDCCFHIKEPAKPRRCGMIEGQIQEEALALLKEQKAKTGHWNGPECSQCHAILEREPRFFKYCPYCGAKMERD